MRILKYFTNNIASMHARPARQQRRDYASHMGAKCRSQNAKQWARRQGLTSSYVDGFAGRAHDRGPSAEGGRVIDPMTMGTSPERRKPSIVRSSSRPFTMAVPLRVARSAAKQTGRQNPGPSERSNKARPEASRQGTLRSCDARERDLPAGAEADRGTGLGAEPETGGGEGSEF